MPQGWNLTATLIFVHGVVFGLSLFGMFGYKYGSIVEALEKWQTLITGIIALFAAWLTVFTLRQQIRVQREQLENEKKRHEDSARSKAWAARAHLPDALSALSAYASRCAKFLLDEQQPATHPVDSSPSEAIGEVKKCIEHVDPASAEKLSELVRFYQIHNSRLRDVRIRNAAEVNDRVLDLARLQALVDRLYEFARNQVSVVPGTPIGRDQLIAGLRNAIGLLQYFANEGRYQRFVDEIERRYDDHLPAA